MMLVDASAIIAASNRRDVNHGLASAWLRVERGGIVPAPLTAEVDYILSTHGKAQAARGFLLDVISGHFRVECLAPEDYPILLSLMDRYRDLDPGLADLSLVVLAFRFNTTRILTFDQRHFREMTPLQGGNFVLLPFDEPRPDAGGA